MTHPLADGLLRQLQKHSDTTNRTRITLTRLLVMQASVEGHSALRPGARQRLHAALQTLSEQGYLEQPIGQHLWDNSGSPALPQWIAVVSSTASSAKTSPSEFLASRSWAPQISPWIRQWAQQTRPAEPMRQALAEVNRWLLAYLGRPKPTVVAREERSLTVFGNEKRLARLERSSLFGQGRLTADVLAYERPIAPLRAARLADNGDLLIVENQSTFDSAWRALAADPGGFAAVAFGNGWEAASADPYTYVAHHLGLTAPPARIWYFGDLDLDGLDIPATLKVNCEALGLPAPLPLITAYEQLLRHAPPSPQSQQGAVANEIAAQAAKWLPEEMSATTRELLIRGDRVPQEHLDRDWWTSTAWRPGQH